MALTSKGVALHPYAGEGDAVLKTADCTVTRDEKAGLTRYGLRLPLATIGMKPGEEYRFNCLVIDDDDGKGMRWWLQLAQGISYPRKIALYPRFVLTK